MGYLFGFTCPSHFQTTKNIRIGQVNYCFLCTKRWFFFHTDNDDLMKNGLGKKVWPVLLFNGMRKILAWLLNLDGILGMLLMNTCSIVSSFFVCTLHDISPACQTQTQPGFNIINFSLHGYLNEIDVWVGIHLIIDLQYYLFKRQTGSVSEKNMLTS